MMHAPFPIFEKLGGLKAAMKLIRRSAIRPSWPSIHTVDYWRRRGRIPSHVELLLRDAAAAKGIGYEAGDYSYRAPAKAPAAKRTTRARKSA